MESILMGLVTKTLNLSEDDIKSVILKEGSETEYKDNALELLLQKDASRITAIKDKYSNDKDDQYKRGKREIAETFEKNIKQLFGFDSDLKGEELLAEAKAKASEGSGGDELTDDKIKASSLYIQQQNNHAKEIKDLNAEWQGKLDAQKGDFDTRVTKSTAVQKAISRIKGKNPILPEEAERAEKRLGVIGNELDRYNWKQDGDTMIPVDENGHQLVDAHEKPITFADIVDNIGDMYFDFADPDDKGGKGGKGGTGNKNDFQQRRAGRVKVPETPEELEQMMKDAKSPEERSELAKAYREAQKPD